MRFLLLSILLPLITNASQIQIQSITCKIIKNEKQFELIKDCKPGQGFVSKFKKPYSFIITIIFNNKNYENLLSPGIYLGKIGDTDTVYLNNKFIGGHGQITGKTKSYYHVPRTYRFSKELLKQTNTLMILGQKSAILKGGLHSSPIEINEYNILKNKKDKILFIGYYLGIILGFFAFVMGLYHLYLYVKIPKQKHNLYYFIVSFFTSGFIYSLAWGFTNHTFNPFFVCYINCFFGVGTSISYHIFAHQFLNKKLTYLDKTFLSVQLVFPILCLIPKDIDLSFNIYSFWFIFALSSIIYCCYIYTDYYFNKNRPDLKILIISMIAMLIFASYDILQSLGFFSSFQLSGLGFFSLNIGMMFSLARDFSDAYLNVEQTVEERTKDLSSAITHIKNIEAQKKLFFTNISHDLKTPISIALSRLDEASNHIKKQGQDTLERGKAALLKLKSMVLDILDTVSSEVGEIKFSWSKTNIIPKIIEWSEDFQLIANRKGKTISVIKKENNLIIPIDLEKFNRIFDNLISNALKYCPANGNIEIRVFKTNSQFYLEVEDSGQGLPENEWKSVFKRFYQGSSTNLKDHGGSGIGLSFVYEVIQQMNGQVYIAHGDKYKIKFVVQLPLNQDTDLLYVDDDKDVSSNTFKSIMEAEYPRKNPNNINPDLPNLLIAEDNPDIADIILQVFNKDYNVYFAENGKEGVEILQKIAIDCIVSDLMMPVMDGSEFLSTVKADQRWKLIPFLMLTSKSDSDNIIEHLKMGAQDYVSKPFEKDVLKARVHSHCMSSLFRKQILNSEKLAALGVLAAGIAHEINNPIHAASNFASAAKKQMNRYFSDKLQTDNHDIQNQHDKINTKMNFALDKVIEKMKKISDLSKAIGGYTSGFKEKTEINVHEMLNDVCLMLSAKTKYLNIEKKYFDRNLHILAYASLNQVFVNLIDNAIDVAKNKIIISTQKSAQRVIIRVSDDGDGIAPNIQSKIFDRFTTTKPPGQGTGLGLSIVKDIVEVQHGGQVQIASSTPQGTIFEVKIPFEAPDSHLEGPNIFHGSEDSRVY